MTRFQELVKQIEYKNWKFHIGTDGCNYCGETGRAWLQVQWPAQDTYSYRMEMQKGRKWLLSEHMTDSEVILTALKAVITAEEHEVRETFQYRGKRIFHPHPSLDILLGAANIQSKRSE